MPTAPATPPGRTAAPGLSVRRTMADLVALDLVEAATQGQESFREAWARVPPGSVQGVLGALSARVLVDDLATGSRRPALPLTRPAQGARAARAAFQIAGSLVAASVDAQDPDLVGRRLAALRASAVDSPATDRRV
ncbi:hypothetical protein ACFVQ3_03780 [Oerskovia sp. NPDC057915]|uniref:hypothetical protein n=1 Tax=Oerskovia sp. NPDC057915 TaxID=3346280 RepID=UPI0036DF43A3